MEKVDGSKHHLFDMNDSVPGYLSDKIDDREKYWIPYVWRPCLQVLLKWCQANSLVSFQQYMWALLKLHLNP